ncbi:MAG: peptide deformylase [Bryobacteraceae bacterium]
MSDFPNHKARLKIVQAGEPVLRQIAKPLKPDDIRSPEIQRLIDWMRQTMYDAPGVGLAAPQVGIPLQLAVIEDKPEYTRDASAAFLAERERQPVPFHVVIDPKLTLHADDEAEFFEGCLSVAGFTAVVPRALRVTVDCLDHNGKPKKIEAQGWYARILQHEIDHLHGALYLDRMLTRTFMTTENYNRHWKEKPVPEALQLLARS